MNRAPVPAISRTSGTAWKVIGNGGDAGRGSPTRSVTSVEWSVSSSDSPLSVSPCDTGEEDEDDELGCSST